MHVADCLDGARQVREHHKVVVAEPGAHPVGEKAGNRGIHVHQKLVALSKAMLLVKALKALHVKVDEHNRVVHRRAVVHHQPAFVAEVHHVLGAGQGIGGAGAVPGLVVVGGKGILRERLFKGDSHGAVLAAPLGFVQLGVRQLNHPPQVLGTGGRAVDVAAAAGGAQQGAAALDRLKVGRPVLQPVAEDLLVHVRYNDEEFVAAEAVAVVAGKDRLQRVGKTAQDFVAHVVAKAIVEELEVVHVGKHDNQVFVDVLVVIVAQRVAVLEPGERVKVGKLAQLAVHRAVFQLQLHRAHLFEVAAGADEGQDDDKHAAVPDVGRGVDHRPHPGHHGARI